MRKSSAVIVHQKSSIRLILRIILLQILFIFQYSKYISSKSKMQIDVKEVKEDCWGKGSSKLGCGCKWVKFCGKFHFRVKFSRHNLDSRSAVATEISRVSPSCSSYFVKTMFVISVQHFFHFIIFSGIFFPMKEKKMSPSPPRFQENLLGNLKVRNQRHLQLNIK